MATNKPLCSAFGTGECCYDKHFDVKAVPEAALKALDLNAESTSVCERSLRQEKLVSHKELVTCQKCLERIHA